MTENHSEMLYGSILDSELQRTIIEQTTEETYTYFLMRYEPVEDEL